jgi:hypothetical protein
MSDTWDYAPFEGVIRLDIEDDYASQCGADFIREPSAAAVARELVDADMRILRATPLPDFHDAIGYLGARKAAQMMHNNTEGYDVR